MPADTPFFHPPFSHDHFYALPVAWLQRVTSPHQLDVLDALFYYADPSLHEIRLPESGSPLHWTHANVAQGIPKLTTALTWNKYLDPLIEGNVLSDPLLEKTFVYGLAFGFIVRAPNSGFVCHLPVTAAGQTLPPVRLEGRGRGLAGAVLAFRRLHWRRLPKHLRQALCRHLRGLAKAIRHQGLSLTHLPGVVYPRGTAALPPWDNLPPPTDAIGKRLVLLLADARQSLQRIVTGRDTTAVLAALEAIIAELGGGPTSEFEHQTQFRIVEPPTSAVVYRPRGYLDHRWPVWLGNDKSGESWGSRAVLLALLHAWATRHPQALGLPPAVPLPAKEIERGVAMLLPHWVPDSLPPKTIHKEIEQGLTELQILGVVHHSNRAYSLAAGVFNAPASWPAPGLLRARPPHAPAEPCWVDTVRAALGYLQRGVNGLPRVWRAVARQQGQALGCLTPADAPAVSEFIRQEKPPARPLSVDSLLERFRASQPLFAQTSAPCTLRLGSPVLSPPVTIPAAPARPFRRLELHIAYRVDRRPLDPADPAHAAAVAACANHAPRWALAVWQQAEGIPSVLIPLSPLLPPAPAQLAAATVYDVSHLHGRVRYDRPIRLLLVAHATSLKLSLRCWFRVLHH